MKIDRISETAAKVTMEGRLDANSAPELETALLKEINDGITDVDFDISGLSYMSSAGLRVLLATHKKLKSVNGSFVIHGVSPMIREIFDITGFSNILTIE